MIHNNNNDSSNRPNENNDNEYNNNDDDDDDDNIEKDVTRKKIEKIIRADEEFFESYYNINEEINE